VNVVKDLERRREELILRVVALDARRSRVAYEVVVDNSQSALEQLHEVIDEVSDLDNQITLTSWALDEARARAEKPDWQEQWRTLVGGH
jgi:hypothetical protein